MLQINSKDLSFLKRYSNTKKHSLKSKKKCYMLITNIQDNFKNPNMKYYGETLISYKQFIQALEDQTKNSVQKQLIQFSLLILKILKNDSELKIAFKWVFKKKDITRYLEKHINKRRINIQFRHAFYWILYKYLKIFIDHSILEDLNLYKTEKEINELERLLKEEFIEFVFHTPRFSKLDLTDYQKIQNIKDRENLKWPEIRHKIFWGKYCASDKIRVDYIYRQIKRFEKVLKPILPIIH